jgi:hypothetical protein
MPVARALALVSPTPLRLRRLGYVRQSNLLHAWSRRRRRAWAPHFERARGHRHGGRGIHPAAPARPRAGLGLPRRRALDALAGLFGGVSLVDAVHPWPARFAAGRCLNVIMMHGEISAGIAGGLRNICDGADLMA